MLSRTAENLYWTGRYVERAENIARILEVSRSISLQATEPALGGAQDEWQSVLAVLGGPPDSGPSQDPMGAEAITRYFTLEDHPGSILFCVRAARENARALRSVVSTEMWESINGTWLGMRDLDAESLDQSKSREFCEWVRDRSHLFRGVSYSTTLHNDGFYFLRLGTFLERAAGTARVLDVKYQVLADAVDSGPATTYYAWGAVLRQVSALRAYHQVFHDVIEPARVAELLTLCPELPRSLRYCADEVCEDLDQLAGGRDLEAQRLAGELRARLRFARMDRILESGLHEFLSEVTGRIADLSNQLNKDFLMTV
jgi:uncharacterized alpha-E superfamily protein